MAIEILSAGMAVKWAVETTAGTRPTTGYATLTGVKSISEDNEAPNTIQTTPLSAMKRHTYILGLQGGDGAQQITVNDYEDFRTSWDAMYSAYETAKADGKALWIEYAYPAGYNMDSYFYTAIPAALGFGGAEVDSVLENTAYLIQTNEPQFAAAST